MKRIFKRVSAAVMALAVAATAVVFDVPGKIIAAATADHTNHAVCGDTSCTEHTTISDWTGISDFNSVSSGNYYLTADVTLTDQVTINAKTDITLCLNGHTITAASGKRIFYVSGSLTLCDCKGTGTLMGGNCNSGAVRVDSSGTFTMSGGTISGNTANAYGGGVYVETSGTFTMSGGTISDNTANARGGGVYVETSGTFTMYDGTISNNTAGGTVEIGGGVYVETSGTFTMSGGTISDNKTKFGGGVYVSVNTNNTDLNGTVNITGNKTSDNAASNVYLTSSKTLTIGDSFSTNSKIGVTTATAPTNCSTGIVAVTGAVSSDISGSFTADIAGQSVVYKDGMVQLALPHTYSDEWSSDGTNHWQVCSDCGDKTDEAEHTFVDKSDDTNHWQECSECGYKKDVAAHSWGDWSLATEPTLTTTGTAERTCSCGEKQTKTDIPKLTDTTVWTKGIRTEPTLNGTGSQKYTSTDYGTATITIPALTDSAWTKDESQHVDPTEDNDGKDVYTSTDYGTVTVVLPKLEHTHEWGEWAITTKPTLTTTGTAERVCTKNDTHIDTTTLPVLTDTSVWTKDDTKHVEPTEETDGEDVYTSEYGEVTVVLPSLGHTHKWGGWTITTEPTLTIDIPNKPFQKSRKVI